MSVIPMRLQAQLVPKHSADYNRYLQESAPNNYRDNPVVYQWKRQNLSNIMRGLERIRMAEQLGIPHFYGALYIKHGDRGQMIDYGLASLRVVTTAGVNYLVSCLQNAAEPENLRYHGIGTGGTAEAAADTALVTELTTQYNPDNTRATGTLTVGAANNVFRTVATNTVDASVTITEHGIFTQAATGGGTLLDRSLFAGIAMVSGNTLQTQYDFTINAGG